MFTIRLYSILGLTDEGKFYNEFNGREFESECAKDFEDQCEKDGIVFVSKEAFALPKTPFDDDKVPDLSFDEWEYETFFWSKTDAPLLSSNHLGQKEREAHSSKSNTLGKILSSL